MTLKARIWECLCAVRVVPLLRPPVHDADPSHRWGM